MILGTGLDIVEISRIQNSLTRYEGRFEERVFTRREIAYCRSKANPARHFAVRFAAKEAVLKSLGTGMADGMTWKDIEILNEASGKPVLHITGRGKELCETLQLKTIHISLSHERNWAIAQAIAETH